MFATFVTKTSVLKECYIKRDNETKHASQLGGIQDQLRRD